MLKLYFAFALVALLSLSCKKEKTRNLPKPLKEMIAATENCTCEPFLDEYEWRNKTVYLWSCKGPSCNCMTIYYDKAGAQQTMEEGYSPDAFRKDARLIQHVWRCKP